MKKTWADFPDNSYVVTDTTTHSKRILWKKLTSETGVYLYGDIPQEFNNTFSLWFMGTTKVPWTWREATEEDFKFCGLDYFDFYVSKVLNADSEELV